MESKHNSTIYNEQVRSQEERKNALIAKVSARLHESWREGCLDKSTGKFVPKFKPTRDQVWIQAHEGQEGIDIANTAFEDLPADLQEENYLSAKLAVERVEDILYLIHDGWLDRNDLTATQEQKAQYSRLTPNEKLKDLDVLEETLQLMRKNLEQAN